MRQEEITEEYITRDYALFPVSFSVITRLEDTETKDEGQSCISLIWCRSLLYGSWSYAEFREQHLANFLDMMREWEKSGDFPEDVA